MELNYLISIIIIYFIMNFLGFFISKKPVIKVTNYEEKFNTLFDKIVGIKKPLHIINGQNAINEFYKFYKNDSRVKLDCELMQLALDAKKKRICNKGVWL